jgi:putative FmdB family regulatory protein
LVIDVPLYEYRCGKCGSRFAQLIGVTADSTEPRCRHCGSREATRLISKFSRIRGEDEKLDALEDAALVGDADDPKAMRRIMGEMAKEMGDELGEDVDELLDESERDLYGEGDVES